MARLDFHKDIDQFIAIGHIVEEMMGDEAPEFVIASSPNHEWYEDLLKKYAERLLKKYRFTGWISNPERIKLLQECKVLCHCGWDRDLTSVTAVEGVYHGKPTMSWDIPQMHDTMHDWLYWAPKGDLEAYATNIVKALRGELPPKDYDKGREFIRRERSHESYAKGVIKLLETFI